MKKLLETVDIEPTKDSGVVRAFIYDITMRTNVGYQVRDQDMIGNKVIVNVLASQIDTSIIAIPSKTAFAKYFSLLTVEVKSDHLSELV